tara:strand:- start:136 stop:513 length:378 start_codon:yes stop_codon:yes gene_type:complete
MKNIILVVLLFTLMLTFFFISIFKITRLKHQFELFFLLLVINGFIFYKIVKNGDENIHNTIINRLIKMGIIIIIIAILLHFFLKVLLYGPSTPNGLIIIGGFAFILILFFGIKSLMNDANKLEFN